VRLGPAKLSFSEVKESREDVWGMWKPKFDVFAHASLEIRIPPDRFQYEGRSHSLWFCDAQEVGIFRWYETSFKFFALSGKRGRLTPFALAPGLEAGKALSPGMTEFEVAWPFTPVEAGNEVDFLERWMTWFAQAAQGQLSDTSSMPERSPVGSWRR
jgi:serine/threonine-protein kinase